MSKPTTDIPSRDTPMADTQIENNSSVCNRVVSSVTGPSIDRTHDVEDIDLQEVLVAVAGTPLKELSRNVETLKTMDPNVTIQRLIWTPMTKWHDLKKLSKYNAGLRVAFSKDNAALLCNFVIKVRYPAEAAYIGLDLSSPLSNKWLTPTGPQVSTIRMCEQMLWNAAISKMGLKGSEHLYELAVSFLKPGPALLFGLESGMVMIMRDPQTGVNTGVAVRHTIAVGALERLTRPWFVKPKAYDGGSVLPRSEEVAIAWFYDQDESREGAVEKLEEILAGAENHEFLNFEGEPFN